MKFFWRLGGRNRAKTPFINPSISLRTSFFAAPYEIEDFQGLNPGNFALQNSTGQYKIKRII